ncbi:WD domain containing protein [Lasiodiplodia theobromae]|uniref:WD domain containing protein n=1 Tax=Lasiodiplodia theobromae TaxID=45133 RepID=UPI0015C30138|nr:WD domain containing protein [Lasiodiplodia theobromae]KAF4535807.1 WD domain containing protein [Lasiodiplodia theobromae]
MRKPTVLHVNTRFGSWKQPMPQNNPIQDWNPPPTSPISPERSPELPSSAPPSSASKSKRAVKSKEMPAPDAAETPKPGKGSRKGARKARGTSVASSAVTGSVRGRTRSQSVASHADEAAPDVKAEPSTPAETMESDVQSTTETPTSGGRRTRRRAGTLQSVLEQTQTANNKRKRDQREESDTAEPDVPDIDIDIGTPGPPTFVIASRNFGRMSVPVMNDITSHKHASLFSHPVKPKDAEGYYDIIRRPQDLKSIRTAITNGSRAVAAATQSTADTPSANSPGGAPATPTQMPSTSTHITLPISEELVPPRGIVNSAQLEKELMRMFANAVMFNSGEDGVVRDAVEMAKDVEASVANWRTAERTSVYEATSNAAASGAGGGGTPADGDVDDAGGKRRKA